MSETPNDIRRRAGKARRLAEALTDARAANALREFAGGLDKRAGEAERLAARTATNVEITHQIAAELRANTAKARRLTKKPEKN